MIFRPTQILPSDVNMKRYNQQGPPDFALNQFAGKGESTLEFLIPVVSLNCMKYI